MMSHYALTVPAELQDHIDETELTTLYASLKERFSSALDDYMEETGELMRELQEALEQGEHAEIARHANLIKGESRIFGLRTLAEVAEAIEEMADVAGDEGFSYSDILHLAEQLGESYEIIELHLADIKIQCT